METSLAYIVFHLRKLSGLDSLRNWRERRKMRREEEQAEKVIVASALSRTFTTLVADQQLSRVTADNWLRKFERNGLAGLLPPPDADKVKADITKRVQKGGKHKKTKFSLVEKPKFSL